VYENMANKNNMWAYWIGIIIVFGTHLYMLFAGLPASQMTIHAVLNLIAGALIAYHEFG